MLLQLPLSSNASSAKREIVNGKWKPGEKPFNPMKETKEEKRGINKNVLAP